MRNVSWTVTTEKAAWQRYAAAPSGSIGDSGVGMPDVIVRLDDERQEIEGFGAAFNEMGWAALELLAEPEREEVLRALFAPGEGANLTSGRLPVGANDFALDWYSYDETPGDLALEHFSIERDLAHLVPFVRAARAHQPELSLWSSPWSPPSWMKTNGHYAAALPIPGSGQVDNGLRRDQVGREGTDMFRVADEEYLRAYAAYFGRYVDAYRALGLEIGTVMPQNEFNSAQVFPSCTWTPAGLSAFLRHLGPEMAARGVEVFLGTLERPDPGLVSAVLADPEAAAVVAGIGAQWHGKGAVPFLHRSHPELRIWQTEQECGDGRNDWRYARYAWGLMRRFLEGGASAYHYWNIALTSGGVSRWGWSQNSLVVVDPETRTHRFTHEYHVLAHVSHAVVRGARVLGTLSYTGFENQLAFRNPDGSVVLVVQNDGAHEQPVSILVGDTVLTPVLPADSLSTFVLTP